MKKLDVNQMEFINAGFNPSGGCIIGLIGTGLAIASLFTGPGAIAGLGALAGVGATLPECFPD